MPESDDTGGQEASARPGDLETVRGLEALEGQHTPGADQGDTALPIFLRSVGPAPRNVPSSVTRPASTSATHELAKIALTGRGRAAEEIAS